MLIFIDKYIPYADINKCWKHGGTDIQAIDDIKNLGAYVCKYITKDTFANFGKHCFARSKNLNGSDMERFYMGCYSDSCIDIQAYDILRELNIDYKAVSHYDYISSTDGSAQEQTVTYYQGSFKNTNILTEARKIDEIKRQIDNLCISKDE